MLLSTPGANASVVVSATGTLVVGGDDDGFEVEITEASFDSAAEKGVISIEHEGGWSPFDSLDGPFGEWLKETFATPKFEGAA